MAAPVQLQPAKPQGGPTGPVLTVHIFLRSGATVRWQGTSDLTGIDKARYFAANVSDDDAPEWRWNNSFGEDLELYKDRNDRTPTTVGSILAREDVTGIVIDVGIVDDPIPAGKDLVQLVGGPRAKKKRGPITLSDVPLGDVDAKHGGDAAANDGAGAYVDSNGRRGGKAGGQDGATGSTHRDGSQGTGASKTGNDASTGVDPDALLSGDSQSTRRGVNPSRKSPTGRKDGSRRGASGNTHSSGRSNGRTDGVSGNESSLTHNANAELAPGAAGNIPDDGGRVGGMAGGESDGREGGLPDGMGWYEVIKINGTAGLAVAVAMVISDADIDGAIENVAKKGAKRVGKKLSKAVGKAAAREEVDALVAKGVEQLEKEMRAHPKWSQLDSARQNDMLARMRFDVEDQVRRRMDKRIKEKLAQYDEAIDDAQEVAARDGDDFFREMSEQLNTERSTYKRAREAVGDLEPPQGSATFRTFDDAHGPPRGVEPAATDAWRRASSYWNDTAMFDGMKVYRRDDLFDPAMIVDGETNLQRMQRGVAPWGSDHRPLEIHHLNQANEGPVVEILADFHDAHSKTIHINGNTIPSGIDRPGFNSWKRRYWQQRATELARARGVPPRGDM